MQSTLFDYDATLSFPFARLTGPGKGSNLIYGKRNISPSPLFLFPLSARIQVAGSAGAPLGLIPCRSRTTSRESSPLLHRIIWSPRDWRFKTWRRFNILEPVRYQNRCSGSGAIHWVGLVDGWCLTGSSILCTLKRRTNQCPCGSAAPRHAGSGHCDL